MAITVSQLLAASYNAVMASIPTNQWAESAFLHELERQGGIKRVPGGPEIEEPLDYQMNPDAEFQATDLEPVSMEKTEILTAAKFSPAQLSVAVKWSKADEAKNPETNQKVALVDSLLKNAAVSHDEVIEQSIFAAAAVDGFLTLPVILPTGGQGTIGGIDASVETWWRNPATTYNANFSDIEAALTTLWNQASKGSGAKLQPSLLVSSADAIGGYEGTLQARQRFINGEDQGKSGFKKLAFKTATYVFSQHAPTTADQIWGFNPKVVKLVAFKNAYRQKGEVQEIQNAHGYVMKMFSALQLVISAKSRAFVAYHA